MFRGTFLQRILIPVVFLSGCSFFSSEQSPHPVALYFQASDQVNPGSMSNSNPVFVQVLQMREVDRFRQADFIALVQDPVSALGGDLTYAAAPVPVQPGEELTMQITPLGSSQFFGIVFHFHHYEQAITRRWVGITHNKNQCVQINLFNLDAEITDKCPAGVSKSWSDKLFFFSN